jgi:endonuclease/exonuclease/phosphatase family metal-dependent hydrolase
LREIDADVVGVQEIYEAQAEDLSRELEARAVMGVTIHHAGGACGNAILTRLPIDGVTTFDLSVDTREPRGGIRADIKVDGQMVHVFNIHFGLRRRERAEQVKWFLERHVLWSGRAGPRVIVGDLNEWFPGRVRQVLKRDFRSLRARWTHPAPLPLWALDRVYWDHDVGGEALRVHQSRTARVASDHLPVVATLRLLADR